MLFHFCGVDITTWSLLSGLKILLNPDHHHESSELALGTKCCCWPCAARCSQSKTKCAFMSSCIIGMCYSSWLSNMTYSLEILFQCQSFLISKHYPERFIFKLKSVHYAKNCYCNNRKVTETSVSLCQSPVRREEAHSRSMKSLI